MPTTNIGMSVPGASSLMGQPSLANQVAGETEEQRKKRLLAQQNGQKLPTGMNSLAPGYGDLLSMR